MAAMLAQAQAEELGAASADADGAVAGVDSLGRAASAPLGRLLHFVTSTPVPSADEAIELLEARPAALLASHRALHGVGGGFEESGGAAGGSDADPTEGTHAALEPLLHWEGAPSPRRQRLLRELYVLRLVVQILHEMLLSATTGVGAASGGAPGRRAATLGRLGYSVLAFAYGARATRAAPDPSRRSVLRPPTRCPPRARPRAAGARPTRRTRPTWPSGCR